MIKLAIIVVIKGANLCIKVVFDFDGTIIDTENTYTTLLISIFPFMV